MKLTQHSIKELKFTKKRYGLLDYPVKSPQEYYNILHDETDIVLFKLLSDEKLGLDFTLYENRLRWIRHEIEIMETELSSDIIYTPEGKKDVETIKDIIYNEGLYGKNIYKK